jgi:peptidyl-prolyl cis-trans isomerase C
MKLLRQPLFHFVALGAVLYGIYAVTSDRIAADESRTIRITASDIELLTATFSRQWQRPPTEGELRNLIDSRVREEVLYREALAVGLDQNDMVVRRRMVQKMDLLSQDLALLTDPADQELQTFFQEHKEEYRIPPRLSFSHVYFNSDRRGPAVEDDARQVLAEITTRTPSPQRAPERGDRFMLGHDFINRSTAEIEREFGSRFAEALSEMEPGWHGPIVSGYGLHLVFIDDRVEARIPDYTEVRDRLVMDYNRMRSERAKNALFEGLLEKYDIEIDDKIVRQLALGAARTPG